MASIQDQDRHFTGQQESSLPKHLISEGTVSRLVNGKFIKGAITNAPMFEELAVEYRDGRKKRLYASTVTYHQLLQDGDVQLFAPLENIAGKFLIIVLSGILFKIDLKSNVAYDITPADAFLPDSSATVHLSYIDNAGGVYGVGGYLSIFNWPNRPIFINHRGARVSNKAAREMPPARVGATVANRAGVISGDNLLWMSDPLGGAQSLAPLTFSETIDASTGFTGQIFTVGSALDVKKVTAVGRLPKFLGPNQAFLAQNMLVSTASNKYIIAASARRSAWADGSVQLITYAGSNDGVAGPLALTDVGDNVLYISTTGRIKALAQDQQRETSLTENFLDDGLGQYLCKRESSFYYREWYSRLDHTHSVIKFHRDRVFATVYPMRVPAKGRLGQKQFTRSHRALAVASMNPNTLLGSQANLSWEGFYDWLNPVSLAIVGDNMYVLSKDVGGRNRIYRFNAFGQDQHVTSLFTRGYFSQYSSKSKSVTRGALYFRSLACPMRVKISFLQNEKWVRGHQGVVKGQLYRFSFNGNKTNAQSIPLKIDIEHLGNRFELEEVNVSGEAHSEE